MNHTLEEKEKENEAVVQVTKRLYSGSMNEGER